MKLSKPQEKLLRRLGHDGAGLIRSFGSNRIILEGISVSYVRVDVLTKLEKLGLVSWRSAPGWRGSRGEITAAGRAWLAAHPVTMSRGREEAP